MSNKQRILVLGGGFSSERSISLKTSANLNEIAKKIFKNVTFFDFVDLRNFLEVLEQFRPTCVLNGLHGVFGEDGGLQSLLDALKIPYTGSGALTSAICMDKYRSTKFVASLDVLVPETVLHGCDAIDCYPLIVKPNNEGSSLGVSKIDKPRQVKEAVKVASRFSKEIVLQEFLRGKEVTVTVFNGKALEPIEIVPKHSFYDYECKYTPGLTDFIIPARLNKRVRNQLLNISEYLYKQFGIRQYCRIDYIVVGEKAYFIEVNTLPGFTQTSLVPKALDFSRISVEEFVKFIVNTATFA
ncbi:MAG: D-alanine--D-alanine ligase [Deltaproteobacteria bacterium]|nr:D-alanine--D-alanine ligase [Deltaproteobacteria bacterium]